MIVSHKHKFIFIKPPKVAGTSIELYLSRICGKDDIITPLGHDPDPKVRSKWGAKQPQNYKIKLAFWHVSLWNIYNRLFLGSGNKFEHWNYNEHLKPRDIKSRVGEDIWRDYMKVSIVRNPWDQAFSQYKWELYQKTFYGSFDKYINTMYRTIWDYYIDEYKNYCIDYIIKFEDLLDDTIDFMNKLGVENLGDVPITKSGIRKEKNYKNQYKNKYLISMVEEKNYYLIKEFHYKF